MWHFRVSMASTELMKHHWCMFGFLDEMYHSGSWNEVYALGGAWFTPVYRGHYRVKNRLALPRMSTASMRACQCIQSGFC